MEKVLKQLESKHHCIFCGRKMTEAYDSCGVDYRCYCPDELKRQQIQHKLRALEEKFAKDKKEILSQLPKVKYEVVQAYVLRSIR